MIFSVNFIPIAFY